MLARVTYHRPSDLSADAQRQFSRGGLLVRATPPQPPAPGSPIELELVTPFGTFCATGNIIQVIPGAGVAIGFSPSDLEGLSEALKEAEAAPAVAGEPPSHQWLTEREPDADEDADEDGDENEDEGEQTVFARVKVASKQDKIHMALHGNKGERAAVLRETDKTLHPFVLKNPGLQLDEVLAIARMTTLAPEIFKQMAERREWFQKPDVATALLRNPKTPVPVAIKMIPFVPDRELRQLAKSTSLRGPLLSAVRRKVVG